MKNENGNYRLLEVEAQGSLLVVTFRGKPYSMTSGNEDVSNHSQRSIVTEFSRRSRKRMLETVARVDRKKIAWGRQAPKFITLTYKENMKQYKESKLHLKRFLERIKYHHDNVSVLWKMEHQKRGAIHFHLLVFGMSFHPIHTKHSKNGMPGLQDMWNECSEQTAQNTLDFVANIRSMNGAMFYVSKYMAKEDSTSAAEEPPAYENGSRIPYSQIANPNMIVMPAHVAPVGGMDLTMRHIFGESSTGRWWGVWGRANFPFATRHKFSEVVPEEVVGEWVDTLPQPSYKKYYSSFTIFADNAAELADRLLRFMAYRQELCENARASYEHSVHYYRVNSIIHNSPNEPYHIIDARNRAMSPKKPVRVSLGD